MLLRVTLALDEAPWSERLRRLMELPDVLVETLADPQQWRAQVSQQTPDVLLISRPLLGENAAAALRGVVKLPRSPGVVVLSNPEDARLRARLLAGGALAVLNPTIGDDDLRDVLRTVLQQQRQTLGWQNGSTTTDIPRLEDFVSVSPAMQSFMDVVRRVTASNTTLLVLGETGVGKERLARAIHQESPRGNEPFVAINCGALAESLLESELFGHEEGAFTGATRSRRGCFELAHRGTLFLDEIGEMPTHLQVKLLRVLQSREVQRVGGESLIPVDVRVIAASNRDLLAEATQGRFRNDLYYRLSVVSLTVPPLRRRREDIPMLVHKYIRYFRGHIPGQVDGLTPVALAALCEYPWPGNVRELINVIERAILLCPGRQITLEELPESLAVDRDDESGDPGLWGEWDGTEFPDEWLEKSWREVRRAALDGIERRYLVGLLRETGGRIGETARRAGMQPRALYEKMKRYRIDKRSFRTYASRAHR